MKKEKLISIIKEEVSSIVKDGIVDTLTRTKEEITKELSKRGMEVRWTKDGTGSITFAGKEEFNLYGEITQGDETASIRAGGVIHKTKGNEVYYKGEVLSSSRMLKIIRDSEEFVQFMVKRAREFKFPRQLGGDFPEWM